MDKLDGVRAVFEKLYKEQTVFIENTHGYDSQKFSLWAGFQLGWQASRESAEPEIKHHQLRELVNTARDTAIKYQGCQCLRSALEASIRNSLTSNGVKIKDE
ncbi:TPA: hypothetical protein ACKRDA_001415 [Proteus mirabilis]